MEEKIKRIVKIEGNCGDAPERRIRLSANDLTMPRIFTQVLFFFDKTVENEVLVTGLAKALKFYPELSGRLEDTEDGGLEIVLNNEGAWLIERETETFKMESLQRTNFKQSALPTDLLSSPIDGAVLQIQITKCADGMVIAVAMHHCLADGRGTFNFINTWAQICRGDEVNAILGPSDRLIYYGDPNGPIDFDHTEYTTEPMKSDDFEAFATMGENLCNCSAGIFKFTKCSLESLKKEATLQLQQLPQDQKVDFVSTNDSLCALLFSSVMRARRITQDDCLLAFACEGRPRHNPPISQHYFGNSNFFVTVGGKRDDVTRHEALGQTAASIRRRISAMTDQRLKSSLNWVAKQSTKKDIRPNFNGVKLNNWTITSWVSFPIYEVDFGCGAPTAFRIPVPRFDGLTILAPSRVKGEIMATIGLNTTAYEQLIKDKHFMNYAELVG